MPTLYCFDVSGPRFRLPPLAESGVIGAQPGCGPVVFPVGQSVGSTSVLPGLGDMVTPLKIWLNDGTRKPVLYDPRNSTQSNGVNLTDTFGLKVEPKPV